MRSCSQSWILLIAVCLTAACWGCRDAEPENDPGKADGPAKVNGLESLPGDETPAVANDPPEPPPRPTIPTVNLSAELAATCLVRTGDSLPEALLVDLDGNEQSLDALRGEKLTVVFFWNSRNLYALAELEDLTGDVAEPYADKGLRVVGINEGDTPEVAAEKVLDAGAEFPVLLDHTGEYFAKIAKEKLPRTYVLDAQGKILWFDIEYSEITRDKLQQTIQVALEEGSRQ